MSDANLLLIFAVAAFACFMLGVLMRSWRREGRMLIEQKPLPPMQGSLDARSRRVDVALGRELMHLLEDGKRVEAAALVRERTGWGAAEAEEAVVKLENMMKRMGL